MSNAEQVFQALQNLPVPERLRVVERVVHELADVSTISPVAEPAAPQRKRSPIGWLADKPAVADAILQSGTEGRAADRMRSLDADEDAR